MHIPVIDITGFEQASEMQQQVIAQQVDAAARDIGFMQITGHGIPAQVLSQLLQGMDDFFSLPLATKELWRPVSKHVNRGYSSPLSERLSYSVGLPSAADLFEAFNVGSTWQDFPPLQLDPASYPDNIWPDQPRSFRSGTEQWFQAAGAVARRMTAIFAKALHLPDDFFKPYQDHSLDVLRLNVYAEVAQAIQLQPDQMGMGAHTDFGIVTVLWADPVAPGLQVLGRDGQWHGVIPAPGALLINLGDMMARWTNDRWLSSMHRVLPPIDSQGRLVRRRSAAYFHDGNADAIVSCLPSCTDATHPPKYPPITVADHIRQKLAGSRGLELNTRAVQEGQRLRQSL